MNLALCSAAAHKPQRDTILIESATGNCARPSETGSHLLEVKTDFNHNANRSAAGKIVVY